ncbi:ABC transporter ATP-binding protein [Agromyces bauzanensis]
MIAFDAVDAGYGGGLVLREVTFETVAGRVACIVGPNGAGKSTVLRVLAGLLAPSSGSVTIGGTPIGGLAPAAVIDHGIVLVPQQNALFPRMSVRENVLMGAYRIRRRRAVIAERFDRVAALYPIIGERSTTAAGLLSGGQRRLVEVARAMMTDPRVVLLDEPSVGLDPTSLEVVGASVRRLADAGTTVIMVEQNVRFGLGIAHDAIVMEGGRVAAQGAASAMLASPEIAEIFLGGHVRSR